MFDEKATTEKAQRVKGTAFSRRSIAAQQIINRTCVHIEQLEELTGLSAQRILIAVTELELCDAIFLSSGRRYSLPGQV